MKEKIVNQKENKIKDKFWIVLFIIASATFAIPSISYLVQNKTIYQFYYVWTFFFKVPATNIDKLLNTIMVIGLFSILFILYFIIAKNHKKIFKTKKAIITTIIITSIIFLMIIPYTSTDVYSYIANGWSGANYNENPYYVSTGEIAQKYQVSDQMFNKVANCWRFETVVYGPLWTLICTVLSWLSFGNIDVALLIFKLANLVVHLINCILIYKITKKNLFVILYGLNPFILFETLANVHNDIFIVLFILLAIYFVKNKKSLFLAVAAVAMATAIKYLAILILPFIVLYAVREKNIKERIICCIVSGIEYIAIIALFYIFYLTDLTVLSGLFVQQGKYNRSIFYLLYEFLGKDTQKLGYLQMGALGLFAIYYIYVVIRLLISKEISFNKTIQKYHLILMIFTFVLITNFNPWYMMWLFPTMFFINGRSIKNVLHLSYAGQVANVASFLLWSEEQYLGLPYFVIMVVVTIILNLISNKTNWKSLIYQKKLKAKQEK